MGVQTATRSHICKLHVRCKDCKINSDVRCTTYWELYSTRVHSKGVALVKSICTSPVLQRFNKLL